jgi:dihydrolipoamide dehydrogenase
VNKRIVIIGGGPGGYVAAIRASQLHNQVIIIEKAELGGTCTNKGCVPTKTLFKSANAFWEINKAAGLGIHASEVSINFSEVMERKRKVVAQLVEGISYLMTKNRIRVIKGTANIWDARTVMIMGTNERIEADNIIIATGSKPASLNIEGFDSGNVMNSDEALEMQQLPESMLIIGGGYVGIEFAQIMHRMGVKITVVEAMPNILPSEDAELAIILQGILQQEGIEIAPKAVVTRIEADRTGRKRVYFKTDDGEGVKVVDKILVAVGRDPKIGDLGVEKVGVKLDHNNYILVNEKMETSIPGIYAIGDVVGGIMLAHAASAEGKCAVENIEGFRSIMNYRTIPKCIYTSPEMAWVGLTENEAKEKYEDSIMIGRFPLIGNAKAQILGEPIGIVKIIATKDGHQVVGLGILSPHATELIGEAVLGMHSEASFGYFATSIHAHPTVSEAIAEAALNLEKKAIHG